MFTLALIGPDGAGKTTVARRLERASPLPVKYIYMGINREAGNIVLPTTRLVHAVYRALGKKQRTGPVVPNAAKAPTRGGLARAIRRLTFTLRKANFIADECLRMVVAWHYSTRGYVVVFDRHCFIDFYRADVAGRTARRPLINRLHGFLLAHVYPRPDLVLCLDAPAATLFARKGEGTIEALEFWRGEYLGMRERFEHFHVVDVTRPEEEVVREVIDHLRRFSAGIEHQAHEAV